MPATFAALRHRNFRLFWCGQCVSLIGTWMQTIGQGWLVLQLTGSPLKLGLVSAAQFLPVMLFSLLGGVIADRFPKRNILLLTQSLLLAQAVVLAVLAGTGAVRYQHILVMAFTLGTINSIDMPTRQAYVMEMASREDVMNAIALNSTAFNSARLIGPALAGLVLARFGAAACFALNAVSFLAVILGLYRIAPGGRGEGSGPRAILREIIGGIWYILGNQTIWEHLLLLAALNIFAMNFGVLVPVFAKFTLGGGADAYGWLMSSIGAGAVVGALALATFSRRGPRLRVLVLAGFGLCLSQLAVSFTRSLALAASVLVLTGMSATSFNASVNTILQIAADDQYRGRVMSVYAVFLAGMTWVGSLLAGSLAEFVGPPFAFAAGGGVGLLAVGAMAVIWYLRRHRAKFVHGGVGEGDEPVVPPAVIDQ